MRYRAHEYEGTRKTARRRGPRSSTTRVWPGARFAGIPMDELLARQWLLARVCPHCGHPPEDFVDEETVVE